MHEACKKRFRSSSEPVHVPVSATVSQEALKSKQRVKMGLCWCSLNFYVILIIQTLFLGNSCRSYSVEKRGFAGGHFPIHATMLLNHLSGQGKVKKWLSKVIKHRNVRMFQRWEIWTVLDLAFVWIHWFLEAEKVVLIVQPFTILLDYFFLAYGCFCPQLLWLNNWCKRPPFLFLKELSDFWHANFWIARQPTTIFLGTKINCHERIL